MKCPRCIETNLVSETYEGVEIDRCKSCQGAWLDEGEISQIVAIREKKFTPKEVDQTIKSRSMGVPENEQNTSLNCPKCQKPMRSFNYGGDTGIILDRCSQHGLWFDSSELEKVQQSREYWEKEAQKRGSEWAKIAASVPKKKGKDPYEGSFSPFKQLVNLFYNE